MMPPPPAPPAPPAPPPLPAPTASAETFVTGNAARAPHPVVAAPYGSRENTERYAGEEIAAIQTVAEAPVSTFSIDVDTGSYANARRFLRDGRMPPQEAVRTEEMINYFRYDYPLPQARTQPFSVTTDVARTPWNPDTRLLRIGLRGYDVTADGRPPANLVFLVDVSGSMGSEDKLPLVKRALSMLADRLGERDRVSIVVYAGAAGIVLEPTNSAAHIRAALECLQAGGSTAGGQGLELAYATARASFIENGINRIFVATDGDFNVGVSSNDAIEQMVERNRESGITLTTLGFGTGNYNEALMERIADIGNGNYAYIDSAMEAQKVLDDQLAATLVTIAGDVKVQVEFNPAQVSEYRLIGYENRLLAEQDFDNDAVDAGEIGAGHQVTALYEIVPAGSRGWLPERRYEANRAAAPHGTGNELGYVKLRYKLPGEEESRLISRPIPARTLATAEAPSGDMAFVSAVAAFGQKLRGDNYLNGFTFPQIEALAGQPSGYWREEFVQLVRLAGSHAPGAVKTENGGGE
ncbi:vWA domain-containing protein [Sphingosinithalassobacter sp. LHW66-3]|uniref:vWA domain-containing protein n=1 Tax=Sphingosinithalassobacter sp. LHW66-3 TaxID=3424718 RepID=UPI003D6C11FC